VRADVVAFSPARDTRARGSIEQRGETMITRKPHTFAGALLAAFVTAFAILTAAALGGSGTGSQFNLGQTNSVSRQSVLTGSAGRAAQLKVRNRGRGPAVEAVVRRGAPPFRVNSRGRVANLNSDLLDGVDGAAYQRRITGTCAAGTAIRVVNADGTVACQLIGTAFWSLTGNAATNPATNFLGTTDAQPLVVRTNNVEAMRVNLGGNVGIGTASPVGRLDAVGTSLGVVGRLGAGTCTSPGVTAGVVGCATTDYGVVGLAPEGVSVAGFAAGGRGVVGSSSTNFGVEGGSASSTGVKGSSSGGIGVHGDAPTRGVVGTSSGGIGVHGDAATRGVVGTLGGTSCAGTFAVGGCGAGETGVFGTSQIRGVQGTLQGTPCPGQYAVGGCSGTAVAVGVFGRSINNTGVMASTDTGNIFLGVTTAAEIPQARIDATGKGFFNGGTQTGGADYAESMRASDDPTALEPGDVLALDPRDGQAVRKSRAANSPLVAGVYSTKPALLAVGEHRIGDSLVGEVPIALVGIVPTKVSAENGRIRVGDLLTSARTPGHAMKAKPLVVRGVKIYPTGAILGKAMQPLRKGKGTIKVLVMLR
jgi:hypothetical protein